MDQSHNSLIESIGVYLPKKEVTSKKILADCKTKLNYPFERLTGINSRHMAGDTEFAIDLAEQAIIKCFEISKNKPGDIELLISCNISRYDGPNFQFSFEPSTSVRLRKLFNMNNAFCFDISNACAGMFTGVNIADSFLKAGIVNKAMIVSGEYITHLTKTAQLEIVNEQDERMACLTLGDSGVAIILEKSDTEGVGFHDIDMYTLSKHSTYCIAKPTQSSAGGAIMLTDSDRIHEVATYASIEHIVHVLRRNNWDRNILNHFIPHQTARVAIGRFVRLFNDVFRSQLLNKNNVIINLKNRGNTSSTTHFLALWDNIHNGHIINGDNVLFAVQASGITLGAAPYTFDDLPERIRNRCNSFCFSKHSNTNQAIEVTKFNCNKTIRIESFGTISEGSTNSDDRSAIKLAAIAAENCFKRSAYSKSDIDILIHTGTHRDDFVCEPALATLIAGKLDINSNSADVNDNKTFAFDIINGSVSFLNSCYVACALINSGKYKHILTLASEVENNVADDGRTTLGLLETGSAAILDMAPTGDESGFLSFSFKYFTDYVDMYYSYIGQENGNSYLSFRKNPSLHDYYLDCIYQTVTQYLNTEDISKSQIKAVFPPQISNDFVVRLQSVLSFSPNSMVNISTNNDYFTSSTLYSLQAALDRKQVQKGDMGLIINVGTGIQVACALYRF
jgi:3-oxoacyl-[acyl-carrier-protein] synthase III